MGRSDGGAIAQYFLYGEREPDTELDRLHVEPILDRSGPNDWQIRPHSHPDHVQVFLLRGGGGVIRFEERLVAIPAASVICVPAGIVHQIDFEPGTEGFVVTASLGCLRSVTAQEPRIRQGLAGAAVHPLAEAEPLGQDMLESFTALLREFTGAAPGRSSALNALFARILVTLFRLSLAGGDRIPLAVDRDYELLQAYRALLEQHFRAERALGFYAGQLAVTKARLNAACKAQGGKTASDLLHERLIVEAKRHLVYTRASVAEVAHLTGFDDPSYFNRFFARRVGLSPGAYRKRAGSEG